MAGPEQEPGVGLRALVGRLAEEFGVDSKVLARVASVYREVRERARRTCSFRLAARSHPRSRLPRPRPASEPVYAALGEWALDAEGEPIERMRRDCLRFQSAMTRGVLRLYSG